MDKKPIIFATLSVVLLWAFYGCNSKAGDKTSLPTSSGKYGEVLAIIDTSLEKQESGKALRGVFQEASEGLPQNEAKFRLATVSNKNFKSILKRSRNLFMVKRKNGSKSGIRIARDVWAKPQLLIEITAASDEDLARIINKNKSTIQDYYNEEEIKRLQEQHAIKPNTEAIERLKKDFSMNMVIPPGFIQMKTDSTGLWFKKEKTIGQHQVIQGILVYKKAYQLETDFKSDSMISSRNTFCQRFVQGSRENSYMTVYETFVPLAREINLNGSYAMEYRGLWNMKNDFMGGPFIHYSFVDEQKGQIIHLDGFVYAPKFNKREYLRELEAILKTAKIN